MKRFKNILVSYDLTDGGEATLDRAIALARQNDAQLTLVQVIDPNWKAAEMIGERRRMLARLASGIVLPESQVATEVRLGVRAEEILAAARERAADLIMMPDEIGSTFTRLLAIDTEAELMRHADCPVWVVRGSDANRYQRIVAAVDAGKPDAYSCTANRRILEMASSLARMEDAELRILYAWEFEGTERERMNSELPPGMYAEQLELGRLRNLEMVAWLVADILGEPLVGQPVAVHGRPEKAIVDYIETAGADLLVMEGSAGNPLTAGFLDTPALQMLRKADCSVLLTRPGPISAPSYVPVMQNASRTL